jgi:hypothetical protein
MAFFFCAGAAGSPVLAADCLSHGDHPGDNATLEIA